MCETLAALRSGMTDHAAAFDARVLSVTAARRVMREASAIEHMAATVKALAATRVAEGGDWRRDGYRSPAEAMAKETGSSVGEAIDALNTAEALEELPAVAEAARRGELSPKQAAAVAGAASVAPSEADRLLEEAKRLPLKELQAECGRTRAAHTDTEAQRRRAHERRHVRKWQDPDGLGHLRAQGRAEDIEAMWPAISGEQDRVFAEARGEARREPTEAYAFDALLRLLTGDASASAPSHKVIVRIDLDTFLRGYPTDGETCDIAGCPVPTSAVEDLLRSGSPFLTGLVTKGEAITGAVHLGRAPTAKQQTGLEWLYPTCAAAGCSQSARLQRDHRDDWARTHFTLFDLLDLLCAHHHGLKTTKGWGLVEGRGKRAFVPPDDPRHPRHANDPPAA
ncbi:MAG: hypothetical protein QOE35_1251 [Actinomycetota bacterium]|jgi:hypothetical protein